LTNSNEALNETLEYNIVREQWETGVALSGNGTWQNFNLNGVMPISYQESRTRTFKKLSCF